ncbi:cell wall metabolism sensor histidine kinase WalK [Oceanobacter sp. 4_MG-2023]|uniref:sensor histidine kinase n=1 Tax=Oceanobacter sp. 4_MG-2023 TaxID=3062623 RepID=UPI002735DB60|nr:HAMP domain-containing sensor histidine kinase [Oceanobacter sp. 4_MG-2023]MDP2546970.1 HAMP domain-containing sensor histidine kinase [Oceanobacter sp. 4_MG-2023]
MDKPDHTYRHPLNPKPSSRVMALGGRLFTRLALALLLILVMLGTLLLGLSGYMSQNHSLNVLQQLNQPVAGYVTRQQPLLDAAGVVDEQALDQLAGHAMVLNPALEIYLLDANGQILGHRLPPDQVHLQRVALAPIQQYLQPNARYPVLGDDPSNPQQRNIFSVAAIPASPASILTASSGDADASGARPLGYVYAVIGGQHYRQLHESVFSSYTFTLGSWLMVGSIVTAVLVGLWIFFVLTRRLTRLRQAVLRYNLLYPDMSVMQPLLQKTPQPSDEIGQLTLAFQQMAAHIQQQFSRVQALDSNRRELIANVSHDLRTPLASIQGYIETALLRLHDGPQQAELRGYLDIASQQSQRLSQLINELFELSLLQADNAEPNSEPFSLLELAHDCLQEFRLKAQQQGVELDLQGQQHDSYVVADIAMIQRVLQNLIDNALRHTSSGGSVVLQIQALEGATRIEIRDTGIGIQQHDIPHIFERYYQASRSQTMASTPTGQVKRQGSGLGLAIVKRILELHQSRIDVESVPGTGTCFRFELANSLPAREATL